MDKENLWQAVLAQIQFQISQANFATWFKNTAIVTQEKEKVTVGAPNDFVKEWLQGKYHKLILQILRSLDENIKEIKYITNGFSFKNKPRVVIAEPEPQAEEQLGFPELKINPDTKLNPKYQFENFIVGPFNELPYAAAMAVSKSPGTVYNPLFVYGSVGLGKTHLLQAIGNDIARNCADKKVKYLSSEKFTSAVVAAIKNHAMESLKSAYREIDVLIIDDIQFIAGKEKTQEEFFHTFNALYENNKQIILSSDRPPKAIPYLEERLRSRFEGGMIADIGFPDFETRVAILKSKAQEKKLELSNQVYEYLASNIQRNIRELEGALTRLTAYYKLNDKVPDLEITKTLLKNIIITAQKVTSPKKIIKSVAEFYDLTEKDIVDVSRRKEIVRPRQIAMYLLRTELNCSFPFMARLLGGRDHTTAIHAFYKIAKEREGNENFGEELELIKNRFYAV